jgi:hypothetical protein
MPQNKGTPPVVLEMEMKRETWFVVGCWCGIKDDTSTYKDQPIYKRRGKRHLIFTDSLNFKMRLILKKGYRQRQLPHFLNKQ